MTIQVKIGEAKTRLSELLAKVEAGEDLVISRGNVPVARVTRIDRSEKFKEIIQEMRQDRACQKAVTRDELLDWRHEGHGH
jgi:prevent-host-death family protein